MFLAGSGLVSRFEPWESLPLISLKNSTNTTLQISVFSINFANSVASAIIYCLPLWFGNNLERHELFSKFKSAIISATFTDDVKLTHLKTLMIRKTRPTIVDIAFCGIKNRDDTKTFQQ